MWHDICIIIYMEQKKLNDPLDNNVNPVYDALNFKGDPMKKRTRERLNLTLNEKREIVQTINNEVRSTTKSVYQICKEYGLKLHHYYNWTKLINQVDSKKLIKPKPVKLVSNPFEKLGFKKSAITQKAPVANMSILKDDKQLAVVFGDVADIRKLLAEMAG